MTAPDRPQGPVSLERLLATYTAWSGRNVLAEAARRAAATGDTDRAEALRAMVDTDASAPNALEALRAQHELASLLDGWRWQTVAAAREAGATWEQVGEATRTDPADAHRDYVERVDNQARYGLTGDRVEDFRAVAGVEPTDQPSALEAGADDTNASENDAMTREHLDSPAPANPSNLERSDETDDLRGRPAGPDPLAADPDDHSHAAAERWGVSDPTSSPLGLSERELIGRAQVCEEVARYGSEGDRGVALADLDVAHQEAERRAELDGPDSLSAQVAGYLNLLREDTDGALTAEAGAWRADLDRLLPRQASAERTTGEVARDVDARMQADPDAGPWTDERGRQWATLSDWAAGTCDPSRATGPVEHPDDPDQLRRRIDRMRARLAAENQQDAADTESERRDRLAHWTADLMTDGDEHAGTRYDTARSDGTGDTP